MTRARIVSTLFLALLIAPALFAAYPSARVAARMVYDPNTSFMVLFGGQTALDTGTAKAYDLDETWIWTGDHWVQLYPAHSPAARSFHVMVYDTLGRRAILFGGKSQAVELNDTWAFDGTDWTQIQTSGAPTARIWSGAAYDRNRNVIVLYGGQVTDPVKKTATALSDTWELDLATNSWKQAGGQGPKVTTPLLAYDVSRNITYMLGTDDKGAPRMYSYGGNGAWTELTPATKPDCVADAGLVYRETDQKLVVYGGTCAGSTTTGETYEWDGTNWTRVTPPTLYPRLTGEAIAYDATRQKVTIFGGTEAFGSTLANTYTYAGGVWSVPADVSVTPGPRSLFALVTDPTNGVVWMYGGQNESFSIADLWKYKGGHWELVTADKIPTDCVTPNGVWDTDRSRLVIVCSDSSVHEFDGTAWTNFNGDTLKVKPQPRRFSAAAYDQSLKKTVIFGGFNETAYVDETWTWDGTAWTQIKGNAPFDRSHAAMWYDPVLKKSVIFGGIGQQSRDSRIERFADMWSFDGKDWTLMKSVTTTPGPRYGARIAINPATGKVLLFGGLKLNVNGASQTQVYANDLWQWDGTTWTQITTDSAPPVRENAGFAFDPSANEFALFAGWAGFYRSDLWTLRGANWTLHKEEVPPAGVQVPPPSPAPRRRSVRS